MATAPTSVGMEEEATCPICLKYLRDPVTLECSHTFCRSCVTNYFETWEEPGDLECPICQAKIQKGNLRPNGQLANITEKIKHLPLNPGKECLCPRHKENLTWFCKEDEELVCSVCEQSLEHRSHTLLSPEEAAQEYKDQICSFLKILKKRRGKIPAYAADTGKERQDLLKEIRSESEKTVAKFRRLHQFLDEQEKLLLAEMEELEKEIAKKRDEYMVRLSEQFSCLERVIEEMEEKCQQPACKLLQDIRSSLQRCEEKAKFENPMAFPSALKWRIWDFCDITPFLEGVMKQFRDALVCGLQLQKANITLDPDTAHPQLILSEDRKSVRWGDVHRDLPPNPERFDRCAFVLGREGFTAGRHFWDVVLGSEERWAVGVARKSMKRKGLFNLNQKEGVWAVGKWGDTYIATKATGNAALSLGAELKKIRVILNCAGGKVCFYNADTAAQIYAYQAASFSGKTLYPFFCAADKAHLTVSP
ncbi:tripartite motif-containing protein 10-like [Elgaria multicarinata webbii]|uniref:tripartite motif-containing protein 10-like n=1 Tax=Elgaria multicarinata webbii TaxID=159646 RepID=UPI002FCD1ECA